MFSNGPLDEVEGRRGNELTKAQLDDVVKRLGEVTDDIGAVVC